MRACAALARSGLAAGHALAQMPAECHPNLAEAQAQAQLVRGRLAELA
jgi:hypothetical protein